MADFFSSSAFAMAQIYSHPGTDVSATFGTDQKDTCISVSSSTHFFVPSTEN